MQPKFPKTKQGTTPLPTALAALQASTDLLLNRRSQSDQFQGGFGEAALGQTLKAMRDLILAGATVIPLINKTGSALPKGTAIALGDYDAPSDRWCAIAADNTVTAKPCVTLLVDALPDGAVLDALSDVLLTGVDVDTSVFAVGAVLYLGTGGNLTITEPTDPAVLDQACAVVVVSDTTNGVVRIKPRTPKAPTTAAAITTAEAYALAKLNSIVLTTRYQLEDLAAGDDVTGRTIFHAPMPCTVKAIYLQPRGDVAGVDAGNTSAFVVTNSSTATTAASKTYNNVTTPPVANGSNGLTNSGTPADLVLATGGLLSLALTNGATADWPLTDIVIEYSPKIAA